MQGMVVASFTGSEKERGPAAFGIWGGGEAVDFCSSLVSIESAPLWGNYYVISRGSRVHVKQ